MGSYNKYLEFAVSGHHSKDDYKCKHCGFTFISLKKPNRCPKCRSRKLAHIKIVYPLIEK